MEENYRWIKCTYVGLDDSYDVEVRQSEESNDVFIDRKGNRIGISDLDFTSIPEEEEMFLQSQENMKRMNEEHERTQSQLREMLAAMDTKSIADHQENIDIRAYWRKLRGEIFMKILERGGVFTREDQFEWAVRQTAQIFDALYDQHQKFVNKD